MTRRRLFWLGWVLALVLTPQVGLGGRCATSERGARSDRFAPLRPAPRRAAGRVAQPVLVAGGHVLTTEHFRLLWGDHYDRADPHWADPDADGVPTWVDTLAGALEDALAVQRSHGFPDPLGLATYFVDVYLGNTGLTIDGSRVNVSSSYYAYTEIDRTWQAAYLVVNDDFSAHTGDELGVLRATAAHELFHAVQAADYPWDDEVAVPDARWEREAWWFEATATWMEEVCAPDVDDYVTYVRRFLERPEAPLSSTDGLREYGAAIFPGHLWLRAGGPAVWQETFRLAHEAGLEPALDQALLGRGLPGFVQAVAAFWSLAVNPEDGWPDGAAFRAAGTPRLLRATSGYPVEATATGAVAPGRLGANLFVLPPTEFPLSLSLTALGADAALFLAVTRSPGGAEEPRVQAPSTDGAPLALDATGSRSRHLAVVNASDAEGSRPYSVAVQAGSEAPEEKGGSGSGGCFLSALL